jgi:hypothetical protein
MRNSIRRGVMVIRQLLARARATGGRPAMKSLTILIVALSAVTTSGNPRSAETPADRPVMKGPYLGMNPPGSEPTVFAPGVVSTDGFLEMGCTFSPDAGEIYFGRSETSEMSSKWSIWVARERAGVWGEPEVASFSGVHRDFAPFVTPDGKHMLFYRQGEESDGVREGTWIVDREEDGWGTPRFFYDAYCLVTADLRTFYFSTDHREQTSRDIATLTFQDGTFSDVQDLRGDINSKEFDAHAYIAAGGDLMIFDSTRPGGFDRADMYVSYRSADGSWSKGYNLGESINKGHHHIPSLSPDGKFLFFSADGDLYWVSAKVIEELNPLK